MPTSLQYLHSKLLFAIYCIDCLYHYFLKPSLWDIIIGWRTFLFGEILKMDTYRIAFIGHREIEGKQYLEVPLDKLIKENLREQDFVELLVGSVGDFNLLASISAKMVQRAVGKQNNRLVLIMPYHTQNDDFYERFYDEVRYIELKNDHQTIASKRNKWMIDHADMLVAYVEPDRNGEAMTALKYAERKGVKIINLAI